MDTIKCSEMHGTRPVEKDHSNLGIDDQFDHDWRIAIKVCADHEHPISRPALYNRLSAITGSDLRSNFTHLGLGRRDRRAAGCQTLS